MSVAAVVVTYNRRKLLFQQIENVVYHQKYKVDEYYIIDNCSSDDTEERVEEIRETVPIKITYVKLENNVGGAGGFYNGVKRAYENGHDWIVLMDDDGRPYDELCFSEVMDYIARNSLDSEGEFLINSLVLNKDNLLSFGLKRIDDVEEIKKLSQDGECIENLVNPFNGTFISKGLVKKIGFPNKDFFIKGDEVDYNRRAINSEARVFTLMSSKYFHPRLDNVKIMNFFGRRVKVYIEAPWKEYYAVRNFTYSARQYNKK